MSNVGGIAVEQLKSFIERIERLRHEKRTLVEDIKEVYVEAKVAASSRRQCASSSRSETWTRTSMTNKKPCSISTNEL